MITAAVHYFHYNSHRHYHYHHFHYHWKMHFYRLKILLTILFFVIWSPICFNLFSVTCMYFSLVLFQAFCFLHPVKGLRISLRILVYDKCKIMKWKYICLIWFDLILYFLFTSIVIYSSLHCVKSVQIRSFFCPVFSSIWTEYRDL